VCTPLTAQTRHAICRDTLAHAKPGLRLINVSRGSCVSEAAVADALEAGRLGGYAADVFEFEDWAWAGRPAEVEPRLRAHAATLLSPHLGSAVEETRREIELAAAAEVVRWVDGEALAYRVN
jgi:phosphonate dehydrogenase